MMADMTHDEMRLLIAPFALGALPSDEEDVVRSHLLSCDECLAEADSYNAVASRLTMSVDPVPLSAGFAERIMGQVELERPTPTPARPRVRRTWQKPAAILSLAGLAAVAVLLAITLVDMRNDLRLEREVTQALLSDEGVQLSGAGARAAMVPTDEGSAFVVEGLAEAPRNKIYQLWLIDEEQPTSAGIFDVDEGRALLETELSLEGIDVVAVTIEPRGGSRQPTTKPIISSS